MKWMNQARRASLGTAGRGRRRAFTLIELLVVLVILALLAGIVLPRFLGANEKAQEKAARTQISSFKQAIQMYMLDHNNQPPSDLSELISDPRDPSKRYLNDITEIPKDPWGNAYVYEPEGPTGDPYVASMGKDGREGGGDDITSVDTGGK